jgi:3-oxoacyl-[acyl-carrier protein] reductase
MPERVVHARCDVAGRKNDCRIVTGAAQGIGQAITRLAIDLGARVIGIDLNGDKLDAFAATTNGKLLPYVGNVADPEFTEATVHDVKARVGAIDGLVNNAGITRPAMIEKMTLQQWSEVISVHLTGAFLWTQAVGRVMVAQGKAGRENPGSIVNIFRRRKSRFYRPDKLCRGKERLARHDDVSR